MTISTFVGGTYNTGYTLASTANDPFTVLSSGSIGGATLYGALYAFGFSGFNWNITNAGRIDGGAVNGIQIGTPSGNAGGIVITNQTGGTISAGNYGIHVFNDAPGSVINQVGATISGTSLSGGVYFSSPATVINYGVISGPGFVPGVAGVRLEGGGEVFNNNTGSAIATIEGFVGVYAAQGISPSTVTNSGEILGMGGDGVRIGSMGNLALDGAVTNMTLGTITGNGFGVQIYSAGVGYVLNEALATISSTNLAGAAIEIYNTGSVANYGVVTTSTFFSGYDGIRMPNGGSVYNSPGARIEGYVALYLGAVTTPAISTITNLSTITGVGGNGIQLGSSGTRVPSGVVTNLSGGIISGNLFGIQIDNAGASYVVNTAGATISGTNSAQGGGVYLYNLGTITNGGLISATPGASGYSGIKMHRGGNVINSASGTISGNRGVSFGYGGFLPSPGTLTNAGKIIAAAGDYAVYFAPAGSAGRLIVDPGAVFTGSIGGGNAGVLELATATTASSLYGFGVTISNFATLAFDSPNWTVGGSMASLGTMAITGFVQGDAIDVKDFQAVSYSFSSNVLTLYSGQTTTMTLNVVGTAGQVFALSAYGIGGTNITECFAAGTRIATPMGDVPVDSLMPGDLVRAQFAGETAIQWIGHRRVDCARHPDPRSVWPVRVSAGAFGAGLPVRDLLLSPNHAVYVCGELIPVRHLINGLSVVQEQVDEIVYYHVELAEHDLLIAEGQPAESYLDIGDRANFGNADNEVRLFPDFASCSTDAAAKWEMRGCAPLLLRGPRLEAVRGRVIELAAAMPIARAA